MRLYVVWFGAVVAAGFLAACGSGSNVASLPVPSASPPVNAIDTVVENTYGGGWGVELGFFKGGRAQYIQGYGLRDRGLPDSFYGPNIWQLTQTDVLLNLPRGQFAPDARTVFDIGSVSKQLTAAAILLLEQDGKLSTTDSVAKYFPMLPGANTMTLVNLLQHSSGFVDYNNFLAPPDFLPAYRAFTASGQTNYQPIVDELATFPLDFTPGTQYEYSNTNYLLLGLIVARISGQTLGDFLQQRIFTPLGMNDTHQGIPPAGTTDLALGYVDVGAGPQRTYQWNLAWLAGPGGITSTVLDLDKWDRALRSPGILSAHSLSEMFTAGPFPQSYGTYAFGWIIATLNGQPFIWHDGAIGGFTSVNAMFPSSDTEIIILTNDASGQDPYFIVPAVLAAGS